MLLESSETKRRTLLARREDRVRAAWRHVEGSPSEIPCLVSSDAHERYNDWGTVSGIYSVKMRYR